MISAIYREVVQLTVKVDELLIAKTAKSAPPKEKFSFPFYKKVEDYENVSLPPSLVSFIRCIYLIFMYLRHKNNKFSILESIQ